MDNKNPNLLFSDIASSNTELLKTTQIIDKLLAKIEAIVTKQNPSGYELRQLRIYSDVLQTLIDRENNLRNYAVKKLELILKQAKEVGVDIKGINIEEILSAERLNLFVDKQITDPVQFTKDRMKYLIVDTDTEDAFTD